MSEDIYGGQDPRDVPAYSVTDAAKYLGVPRATLRAWTMGQGSGERRFHWVIRPADRDTGLLSFVNLIEIHVLSVLRIQHRMSLPKLRRTIKYLKGLTGSDRPLADLKLKTDGVNLFLDATKEVLINVSSEGQLAARQLVEAYLRRVEWDEKGVVRLFPFTRKREVHSPSDLGSDPRIVVIDPTVSFGRPVLAGTHIRTAIVFSRHMAGESVSDLAEDYGRDSLEIEEAIRCETPAAAA